MSIEKRAHTRFPARVRVVLEHAGVRTEAFSRDLSLGGMFVETASPFPYGAEVVAEVHLPALVRPSPIRCTVRWVIAAGVGVQFGALRVAETWAINLLAAQHQRSR